MRICDVRRPATTATLMAVMALAACLPSPAGDQDAPGGSLGAPIVNGDVETGWSAVGTLTASQGGYYMGTFCTATLIAPQWVLTAAHCVTPSQEFPVTPQMTRFFVGDDAQPIGQYEPPQEGVFYPADKFYPHPDYAASDWSVDNDVALVHLAKPVTGVTPIAINTKALDSSYRDRSVLYVGFGNSDGYNGQSAGVKLSGHMRLLSVGAHDYTSVYEGQGVCAGDSGGPGLLESGGQWVVIGVNSTVGNDQGGDPCTGVANHMRVDVYAPWISGITTLPPPDCRKDAAVCECAAACQDDGTCDNNSCQNFDCAAIYDCMVNCADDQACAEACYGRGTPDSQATMAAMLQCFDDRCSGASSDQDFQNCVYDQCGGELNACFPQPSGDLTCEQAYGCMVECPESSQSCFGGCWDQGTAAAQGQLGALFQCLQDQCGSAASDEEYRQCARTRCESQLVACLPPTECGLMGGDCPEGQACTPYLSSHTDCAQSAGAGLGEGCDPGREDMLPCADGLACLAEGEASLCRQVCYDDADCAGGTCVGPVLDGRPEGVCVTAPCVDGDGDGHCGDDDCDDGDPAVYAGAAERCGDGVDGDCDGQTDEGCGDCTDADGDGYCEADDCDDGAASVRPGGAEQCGNERDDDCDGQTDEDCGDCTDGDGDGFCAGIDCADDDAAVNPDGFEICGNRADDDCDGQADEGCPDCVDGDADGFCDGNDCDDGDRAVNPGVDETCANDVDDDCDGRTDEGCNGCPDEDGDGTCADQDCDDQDPAIYPGHPEIVGNGRDDDCDGRVDNGKSSGGCAAGAAVPAAGTGPLLAWGASLLALALRRRRARQ